ncbi:MAG: hypothetical protein MUF31_13160 [Akkermansiaceae bacterium]|nr:hypothetical protein [Akkermansiaceae bacterium]
MAPYQHPSELNPLQQYRQAAAILRGTSRAVNDNWYKSALDLDFQLHIRDDGESVESWTYHAPTSTWAPGPKIGTDGTSVDSVANVAAEIIAAARKAGCTAVGVVVHVADEFATTELKPELDNPGALAELRESIVTDPHSILDDSSLSPTDHSWRLLPYPAAGSETIATIVALTRRLEAFVSAFRDYGTAKNFPVRTITLSEPVVALLTLPEIRKEALSRPILAVLPYTRFTILAFFNEHGDLRLIRSLQHRGQRRPTNLRHAAATTAAALEFASPDIYILPLGGPTDPQLQSDLSLVFEHSTIHEIDWSSTPFSVSQMPGVSPEMVASTRLAESIDTPLAASHTFTTLRSEGWATQDFLPLAPALSEVFPSRAEMKMLQSSRYLKFALAILLFAVIAWSVFGVLDMIRKPEWTFQESEASTVAARLGELGKEKSRIEHWDNLLEDRSKAWASMEMLARLFPDNSGFLVRAFNHTATPDPAAGQARLGFVKVWTITGLAQEDSMERLNTLNTREGISAVFAEVARITGNQSFRTDLPSRSITISIRTSENPGYRPKPPEDIVAGDESAFPYAFEISIKQRFEGDDPLAIVVAAAP